MATFENPRRRDDHPPESGDRVATRHLLVRQLFTLATGFQPGKHRAKKGGMRDPCPTTRRSRSFQNQHTCPIQPSGPHRARHDRRKDTTFRPTRTVIRAPCPFVLLPQKQSGGRDKRATHLEDYKREFQANTTCFEPI